MKLLDNEFALIIVYVDNINIIETSNKLTKGNWLLKERIQDEGFWKGKFLFNIRDWVFNVRNILI